MSRELLPTSSIEANKIREKLKDSASEFFINEDNVTVSVDGDSQFTRLWQLGVKDEFSQIRYFLDRYTDVKNSNASKFVVDPKVGNTVLKGRYRQAFVRRIERLDRGTTTYWVAQTLRQGWALELDWEEARLSKGNDLPGNATGTGNETSDSPEKYIYAEFSGVSNSAVQSFMASLSTIYNTVIIETMEYGNNWHLVQAFHEKQDDGSSTITVKLARPQYTLEAFSNVGGSRETDDLYLWNVPKDLAQTIINANEAAGKTARPMYRGELVDIIITTAVFDDLVARYDSLETHLTEEDTIIYENKSTPIDALDSRGQGSIYRATNSFNSVGGYDARLVYTKSKADIIEFASMSSAFKAIQSTIYKNSNTSISAPANSGSGIYRAAQSINEDGTYDGRQQYTYGTGAGVYEYKSLDSALMEETETIYKDSNNAISADDDVQGGIYRASNSMTEDGLYNSRKIYRASVENDVTINSLNSAFKTQKSRIYKNSRTPISAPSPSGGASIYQATNSFNLDGTYDGRIAWTESNNSGVYEFSSTNTYLNGNLSTIYKNVSNPIAAEDNLLGGVYQASNSMLEDGTYNANSVYAGSKAAAHYSYWPTRYGDGEAYIYKNWRSAINFSSFLNSDKSNNVSPSINIDGTNNYTITRTPYVGSGSTDFWDDFRYKFRYYSTGIASSIGVYIYHTRDLETAETWLALAHADGTLGGNNLIAANMDHAGKGRFAAHYRSKIT